MDESMAVVKRLKNNDWSMANVILDFKELTVLKCSINGIVVPKDWDRIVSYYYQHYSATIERLFQDNGHKLAKPDQNTPEKQPTENHPG